MRGHIKKRSKGSYSIVVELGRDPKSGRRRQQWITVRGTMRDAERRLTEIQNQVDTGTFVEPKRTTVAEYLHFWMEKYAKPNLGPRTCEGYDTIIRRHLVPGLGSVILARLEPQHVQAYYADKMTNGRCDGTGALSARTVRHHAMLLHKALESAVKWRILARNPADAVDPPRAHRVEWHGFSSEDATRLLQSAQDTPYSALFHAAIYTGMRRSELLALRWSDVDLKLRRIHVTRSLHQLRDRQIVIRPPKSARGRRLIELSPSVAQVLQRQRVRREAEVAIMGKSWNDDEYVFIRDAQGNPMIPDSVTQAWKRIVRRCGLTGVRLHDARHAHASVLLKAGVHPAVVAERLGHASVTTTLDIYSHVVPSLQRQAADQFDRAMDLEESATQEEVR